MSGRARSVSDFHSNSSFERSVNSAIHEVVQGIAKIPEGIKTQLSREKKKHVDEKIPAANPEELMEDSDWEEDTHPDAKAAGHRKFQNKKTGERLEFDKGKPGEPGHRGSDHWHRPNPNSTSKRDKYLDENGNPVADHSNASHLYSPQQIKQDK